MGVFLNSINDIANMDIRINEIKEYLDRIDKRIDTIYSDMGYIRENMATREDVNILREVMATSKDVDRLWKINLIFITAIVSLSATLIYFLLSN